MNINERLKSIRLRIEKLTAPFKYGNGILDILTICYYAITTFDSEVEDILEEVLSTRYILINEGQYDSMLEKYYPLVSRDHSTYVPPSFDDKRIYNNDFIVIKWDFNDFVEVFDDFLHELKHAMNSIIHAYDNDRGYGVFYCGLSETDNGTTIYKMLEETFNSYLVKRYLEIIYELSKEDLEEKSYIKEMLKDFNLKGYSYGYNQSTRLLEPLFKNNEYFPLFYNATLYKDYRILFDKLDILFGDPFYVLDILLTRYYYNVSNDILQYTRHLKKNT
ncbi:MAG: hypothetical protein NC483_07605 [Ruminococcus sp.]|nr:hypothetical protein [Ruminococcus sp.]